MRGVVAAGGSLEIDWSIERVLAAADRAVLDGLWLGPELTMRDGIVSHDNAAPLAAIRESITK